MPKRAEANGHTEGATLAPPIDPETAIQDLERIRELNREVSKKRAKWMESDRVAKADKKALEAAQGDLNDFVKSLDEEHPLFDKPAEAWRAVKIADLRINDGELINPETVAALAAVSVRTLGDLADYVDAGKILTDLTNIDLATADELLDYLDDQRSMKDEAAAEGEAWRTIPIDHLVGLGLPKSIAVKLCDAGLATVGALADYSKSDELLADIKGIGDAAADKIDDALDQFWKARDVIAKGHAGETDAPEPEKKPRSAGRKPTQPRA